MHDFPKIARAKYLADRSQRNQRSYQAKIERGECGHCSELLAPNSKSCCVKHLEYFRHKTRKARGVQSNITALAARMSVFPKPADVRSAMSDKVYYDWYDSADILRPDVPRIPPTSSGQHKQSLVECSSVGSIAADLRERPIAQGCTPDEALCCPDSPPRIPPTTTADSLHRDAATGAALPTGTVDGPAPTPRKEIV